MNKKETRETVRAMYDGRCAYCGRELGDRWHVDHIDPLLRGWDGRGGDDSIENMMPSCPRCNIWKHSFTVEQFREEIAKQPDRLRRNSAGFRLAEDFGLVKVLEIEHKVVFYFERSQR